MAALGSQSIASSYEQLLHVDRDGGGNTTNLVDIKDGDNGTTFALRLATDKVQVNGTLTVGVDDTGHDVKFFGDTATNGYMLWDASTDDLILGSSSKLGIGVTVPVNTLHVRTSEVSSAGTDAGDTAIFEDSVDARINLITGTARRNGIFFSDTTRGVGRIDYNHDTDIMEFRAGGTDVMKIDSNSRISLSNNDSGTQNTVFGSLAGNIDAGSNYNVFIGHNVAGGSLNDATENVGVGYSALANLTSGDANVAIGRSALISLNTGSKNTAFGYQSANTVTSGTENTVVGYDADASASGAVNQTVIGSEATGVADNSVTLGNASVTDVYMSQDSQAYVHSQNVPNHVANTMSSPYYRFDGVDDYIQIDDSPHLDGFTAFSITAKVYLQSISVMGIASKYATAGQRAYSFYISGSGGLLLAVSTDGSNLDEESTTSTPLTTAGVWYDVAVTFNAGTVLFYVNGVVQPSDGGNALTSIKAGSDPLLIGTRITNSTDNFDGEIQNLKVWNKALTATEIKDDYSGASVPFKYKGANQTSTTTGNDSTFAGAGNWSDLGTMTDTVGSGVYTLTGNGGEDYIYLASKFTVGKAYRVTLTLQRTGGSDATINVGSTISGTATSGDTLGSYFSITTTSSAVTYSGEFIADNTDFRIGNLSGFSGTTITLDNITSVPIGAVAEYDGSGAGEKIWGDKSGNDLHGTVDGATLENTPYDSGTEYEEGTFTPSLGGNTTYNAQVGNYTKIGRKVTCIMSLNINAIGTGSTHTISGLPYPSMNATEASGYVGFFSGSANTVSTINPSVNNDASTVTLCSVGGSGATATATSTAIFANSTSIRINVTYFTD